MKLFKDSIWMSIQTINEKELGTLTSDLKKIYQQCYVKTHGKSKTHWKILLMFIFRNEHGKNMGLTFIHVVKQ